MDSSKSAALVGIEYGLPNITPSMSLDPVTGRPRLYGPGTGLVRTVSRTNRNCTLCGKDRGTPRGTLGPSCKDCYNQARSVKILLRCLWCGEEFKKPRYEY